MSVSSKFISVFSNAINPTHQTVLSESDNLQDLINGVLAGIPITQVKLGNISVSTAETRQNYNAGVAFKDDSSNAYPVAVTTGDTKRYQVVLFRRDNNSLADADINISLNDLAVDLDNAHVEFRINEVDGECGGVIVYQTDLIP